MKFLNLIIDKLQATFPPNRVMLILAGPIVAAAAWTSAFVTANVPGVEVPVAAVTVVISAAALIAVTLIHKWFDQWQKGEPIDIDADLQAAFEEIVGNHEAIDEILGTNEAVGKMIDDLRERVVEAKTNDTEIAQELETIGIAIQALIDRHELPDVEVPSPASAETAAPPTAATAE